MNANFKRTSKIERILPAAAFGGMLLILFLGVALTSEWLMLFSVFWFMLVCISDAYLKGIITADENGIECFYKLAVFTLWHKSIAYSEMRGAGCRVQRRQNNSKHSRSRYYYILILEIKTDGGKVYDFSTPLHIPSEFFQNDSGFTEFIREQPLMQICDSVNEQTGNPQCIVEMPRR